MKILVIGGGGREHALAWKLAQSPRVTELLCAPGNAGVAGEIVRGTGTAVQCSPTGAEDVTALRDLARRERVDLTVVGPDNPLALGIVDRFEEAGLRAWGPSRAAARFESSKVFAQEFMERHGIPTARARHFTDADAARAFVRELEGRCAVKADGLALGKGVVVCEEVAAAEEAVTAAMDRGAFGEAGRRLLIQELLVGREVSLHALCDGEHAVLFPGSQDHKRAFDGDLGPNTGGMGTFSPAPFIDGPMLDDMRRKIVEPFLAGCREEGLRFRGMLYPGVMLTADGPRVLEFNVRFGDPETQVYLMRLETDLLDLLEASVEGALEGVRPEWVDDAAVCVVLASAGYPGHYAKGKPIRGIEAAESRSGVKVFHAGTRRDQAGGLVTSGGRVLGVTALGSDLSEARTRAYEAVEDIEFEGATFRSDIAGRTESTP